MILRPADLCLAYDSWEDAVSYFTGRYPDLYGLEAKMYGEDTLWDDKEGDPERIFYEVKETEGDHGFFIWNETVYEVFSYGGCDDKKMTDTVREMAGYDCDPCFIWEKKEDGRLVYLDNFKGNYFYKEVLGDETIIRLQAKIVDVIEGECNTVVYDVEVFDEEGERLLQEIQADSTYAHESPFVFEDFNADGYLDLTVEYYYGANGGSASHYIFSPSKKEFVKLDEELESYCTYRVDLETRRLYISYHWNVFNYGEATYQWKNEMDYEMIREFECSGRDDQEQVCIIRYENGEEEVLSNYTYSLQEYEERDDILGTYYEDFLWEKEVTDKTTGKKYMLRYAEVFIPEYAERNTGINYGVYYDGRIYVYDEDTYLIRVIHSEIASEAESIEWEDGDGKTEQALEVHYPNDGRSIYPLSALIRPDYQ